MHSEFHVSLDGMQFWITVASGFSILLFLMFLWSVSGHVNESRLRRQMIERHRDTLRAGSLRRQRDRRTLSAGAWAAHLVNLLALIPSQIREDKRKEIIAAGIYRNSAPVIYWLVKILFIFIAVSLAILIFVTRPEKIAGLPILIMPIIFALGFVAPDLIIRYKRSLRLKALQRGLPDGLDLLVICAEAGLSLDASLRRVADEFGSAIPEISEELLLTSVELNFLPDRRQALLNLAQRVDLPVFRGVVTTLIQTEKYGTPLAATLRTLAMEFREHRLLAAEEKAARLPAILTVPMIVFILPALFIVLAAPAAIQISRQLID